MAGRCAADSEAVRAGFSHAVKFLHRSVFCFATANDVALKIFGKHAKFGVRFIVRGAYLGA